MLPTQVGVLRFSITKKSGLLQWRASKMHISNYFQHLNELSTSIACSTVRFVVTIYCTLYSFVP